MPSRKTKIITKRHGTGFIRKLPSGAWRGEVNHAGRRHRKAFRLEAEARAWVDATTATLARQAEPLDAIAIEDARRAMALLPPGVSLTQAAEAYLNQQPTIPSVTLEEAVEAFIAEKASAGLRPRALTSLGGQCRRLARSLGSRLVADITTRDLLQWLDEQGHTGTTRGNYRRAWSNLWRWCLTSGYTTSNPIEAITAPRVDEALPGILSVEEATQLMLYIEENCPRHVAAYAALCLFAGLRPQEANRLAWSDVNDHHIRIGSSVAKTRQQRLVNIEPNLCAWIAATRDEGRVCPTSVRHELRRARLAVGIEPWPQDAMRHSFATYHLARWEDAARTAHQMGHRGTDMLYRHYRALATQADSVRYWEIRPQNVHEDS